jgi:hypothetical protein
LTDLAFIAQDKVKYGSKKSLGTNEPRALPDFGYIYDGASRETREGTPPLNQQYTTYIDEVDIPARKLQ